MLLKRFVRRRRSHLASSAPFVPSTPPFPLALLTAYTRPSSLPTNTRPASSKHGDDDTPAPVITSHRCSTTGPGGPPFTLYPVCRSSCRNCGHSGTPDADADTLPDALYDLEPLLVALADATAGPDADLVALPDSDTVAVSDTDPVTDSDTDAVTLIVPLVDAVALSLTVTLRVSDTEPVTLLLLDADSDSDAVALPLLLPLALAVALPLPLALGVPLSDTDRELLSDAVCDSLLDTLAAALSLMLADCDSEIVRVTNMDSNTRCVTPSLYLISEHGRAGPAGLKHAKRHTL